MQAGTTEVYMVKMQELLDHLDEAANLAELLCLDGVTAPRNRMLDELDDMRLVVIDKISAG